MQEYTHGTSEGVTGSDGGGGRLIKVGALDIATVCRALVVVRKGSGVACSSVSAASASEGAVHKDMSLSSGRGVVRE